MDHDPVLGARFDCSCARCLAEDALVGRLSCGCIGSAGAIFAEWDTQTREGTPAVATGVLCFQHFNDWGARYASA